MEPVAGNVLEQPPADNFVAFFLRSGAPGRFNPGEGLLEPDQGFLTALAANLDLRSRKRGHEQGAGAGLDRLGQGLDETEIGVEGTGRQAVDLVDLAQIGDPLVDQDQARRTLRKDRFEEVRPGSDALGVVVGDHVEGCGAAQLPGHFAPGCANLAAAFLNAHVLRPAPRADHNRAVDVLRHRCAVLRKQLIETGQVPRRRSACHVVERQHGMGFAAAEVGLKLDHRVAAGAGESLGRADQKRAEAVG